MYYKKLETEVPITKIGCVYESFYFYGGCLFLKYSDDNVPSEELTEITQEEFEKNEPLPESTIPVLTDFELLMQANTDAELRDLEIRQNQELLAQQITDIEVALLGGDR